MADLPKQNSTPSTIPQPTMDKFTEKPITDAPQVEKTDTNKTNLCLVNRSKREFTDEIIGKSQSKKYRGLAILGIIALLGAWLAFFTYKTLYAPLEMNKQLLNIDKGETYYGLIDQLDKKKSLFSSAIAKLYVKTQLKAPLVAGVYQMPANPSLVQMLEILQQGEKVALLKVQIIEGKTAKTLYNTLNGMPTIKKEVLTLPPDQQVIALALPLPPEYTPNGNLEGWFAPDTYYFNEASTDKKVLTTLFDKQYKTLMENWNTRQADLPYKTPYEALIMASIIEKETSVPAERNEVAGVFINRLKKGMRLQTDPTVIYGMGERYKGNITKADLGEKTAYNTYQIDGLPPTPIALPSAESIKAAMNPNATDSLYFVATGNGGHKFTNNLAEHNQAVQDYLKVMRDKKAQAAE